MKRGILAGVITIPPPSGERDTRAGAVLDSLRQTALTQIDRELYEIPADSRAVTGLVTRASIWPLWSVLRQGVSR